MTNSCLICIVDDDPDVLESTAALLESAGHSTLTYTSPSAFLESDVQECGCLIVDLRMPEMNGLMLQQHLSQRVPDLPCIFISGEGELRVAVEAMKHGAVDFLEKPFAEDDLLTAVQRALERRQAAQEGQAIQCHAAKRISTLSPREQEVLAAVAEGAPSKVIADKFGISRRTVEIHRTNIMRKVGVRNLAELVRLAHQAGSAAGSAPVKM
ncbi:response regulator transcription factor [Consotaella salsifontis]|uniref:Two component transcriptional regulator, LuxR family n=1 Tax=Consotaella salsifontis TaxID=1365950 RepID=A0A1T4NJQ9_9HYPH|nr:response regulator [Consotaella salsifontis]SJZ79257.1 two component transcriptional regulator, LuxR family [Consotaella salsifontis]